MAPPLGHELIYYLSVQFACLRVKHPTQNYPQLFYAQFHAVTGARSLGSPAIADGCGIALVDQLVFALA